jgi:CHASE2 domain-containing sensor protein/tRNA A-37 threonylcarbamoyl transferase component Bud32
VTIRKQALLLGLLVSGLVIGVRQLGLLERWELNAYDQFVRWQPAQAPDPRLLVVGITEEEITNPGKSDRVISQLINKLTAYQPRLIGLDIYRDIPAEPGHIELLADLQVNDKVIAICQSGKGSMTGVAPPKDFPEHRLGFSDLVLDIDGIVRRNLLSLTPDPNSKCPAPESFGLRLALSYLQQQNIKWQQTPQGQLQIGTTTFPALEVDSGNYHNLDARGYQIFLRYHSTTVARQVTLRQILQGDVKPEWLKDKIILIGVTAESGNDLFYTPFSAGQQGQRMPGVMVHAQMISQILGATLDRQPLPWFWPTIVEWSWIWLWGTAGVLLAWQVKRPLFLVVLAGTGFVLLTGIAYALFTQAGWIPLIPAGLALGGGIVAVLATKAFQPPTSQLNEPAGAPTLVSANTANTSNTARTQPSLRPELQNQQAADSSLLKGRYRLVNQLGRGGFGVTYLAQDTQRPKDPTCVVKKLNPNAASIEEFDFAKQLFLREAEMLEDLGNHDQIPRLLAYFDQANEFYLVQEYIEGTVLNQEIGEGQPLPEPTVIALLKDVLTVLEFIHSRGVIHRDIKPANLIRRASDQRIVVIDFGAVKQLQSTVNFKPGTAMEAATMIGTRGYSAPEQFLEGQPVFSSDLYSLGMTAIQALEGLSLTDLQKITAVDADWPPQLQIRQPLAAILTKMIQPNPSDRFQSAHEVLQELAQL